MATPNGRHRLGRPGLEHRRDLLPEGPRQRARHRRRRRVITAERMSVLVATVTVVAIVVSGWYAASGATAVAQMLAK
jgi:hypothetical protein